MNTVCVTPKIGLQHKDEEVTDSKIKLQNSYKKSQKLEPEETSTMS
jgi:hypothetical protein